MSQMRSLKDRISDSDKWAKKLLADEEAEYWDPIPYEERRELVKERSQELEDMAVKREMIKLEILVLGGPKNPEY